MSTTPRTAARKTPWMRPPKGDGEVPARWKFVRDIE
jgi:hypothetical protein